MKDDMSELWDLVVAYLKQETLEPLKGLARYVSFGVAGSVVMVMGVGLLLLGILRLVQSETGSAFSGHLSWIPYIITLGATLLVSGAGALGILRAKGSENRIEKGERL